MTKCTITIEDMPNGTIQTEFDFGGEIDTKTENSLAQNAALWFAAVLAKRIEIPGVDVANAQHFWHDGEGNKVG